VLTQFIHSRPKLKLWVLFVVVLFVLINHHECMLSRVSNSGEKQPQKHRKYLVEFMEMIKRGTWVIAKNIQGVGYR